MTSGTKPGFCPLRFPKLLLLPPPLPHLGHVTGIRIAQACILRDKIIEGHGFDSWRMENVLEVGFQLSVGLMSARPKAASSKKMPQRTFARNFVNSDWPTKLRLYIG